MGGIIDAQKCLKLQKLVKRIMGGETRITMHVGR